MGDTLPARSLESDANVLPDTHGLSAQNLFRSIHKQILDTNHSTDLAFPHIAPSTGYHLSITLVEDPEIERTRPRISYDSISQILTIRIMPTQIHDCHQTWMWHEISEMYTSGFLLPDERRLLKTLSGTTFKNFAPPYTSSIKEPDACIQPRGLALPTIVIESGWTESWPRLNRDKDLWLVGGSQHVQVVFLIKWARVEGGKVKGELEVHGRDLAGNVALLQTESIFPTPPGNPNQVITISRGQIFGTSLLPGRNPGDVYNLRIAELRWNAEDAITLMGLVPA